MQTRRYRTTVVKGIFVIDEIHIRDVALIHEARFTPSESLTVITGETGTGKTALLNALKLLVGERSDAGLVREGAGELNVEGRFFFEGEEEGVVVIRRVGVQGRSRVSIDGSLASVKELASRIGAHVDLCGQHEHQHLLSPIYQRQLLDAWAGEAVLPFLKDYQTKFSLVKEAQAELDRLLDLESADGVELDRARFALEQIAAVDPQEGEYEDLQAILPRLEHAEMLQSEAVNAQTQLSSSEGVLEKLDAVLSSLSKIAAVDESVEEQCNTVREAFFTLEDVARTMATYRDQVEFSGEELEEVQERMASLQGLMRGFGPRMEDVFALREESHAKLAEYEGRDELIEQARKNRVAAENELEAAAHALEKARKAVVPQFLAEVQKQMSRLEMGSAKLEADLVALPRDQWDSWGPHTCEFMYAAGEAMKPQRLQKIASGGEMSRIMLALKVVLGKNDNVDTLVFDEIDAGVGGSTARSLADVLRDLSATHQVIVVTHLPQVAVCGDVHYLVTKSESAMPETYLTLLSEDERVKEIARMLSGEANEVALTHARELLEERKLGFGAE